MNLGVSSMPAIRPIGAPIAFECVVDRIIPAAGDLDDHVVWGEVVRVHIREDLYLERGRIDTAAISAVDRLAAEYTLVNNVFIPPVADDTLAARDRRRMGRLDGGDTDFSPISSAQWLPSGSTPA